LRFQEKSEVALILVVFLLSVSSRFFRAVVVTIGTTPGHENARLNPRKGTMKISLLFAFLWLAIGFTVPTFGQQQDTATPPESEQAKQIVAMVEKAATLIDSKGKSIFPEFRKTGSEWRTGDTYLFVHDLKGVTLFNAGFPEREGTNTSNSKDSNGKLFLAEFAKVVQSKGSGWVDYMFPKPGQSRPSQKWSYVKAVNIDGTPGLVGAGFYPQ
jgi:cytochrome c